MSQHIHDCIHSPNGGLCPTCRRDYEEDPTSWLEYGPHPAGEANARELMEEIASDALRPDVVIEPAGDEIPF